MSLGSAVARSQACKVSTSKLEPPWPYYSHMQGQEGVYPEQYCFNDCAKHITGKRRARGSR